MVVRSTCLVCIFGRIPTVDRKISTAKGSRSLTTLCTKIYVFKSFRHISVLRLTQITKSLTLKISQSMVSMTVQCVYKNHCLTLSLPLPVQYLRDALSPFIHHLLEMEDDCEVDPMKISQGANLQHNQAALTRLVGKAWNDILTSYTKFPRYIHVYR